MRLHLLSDIHNEFPRTIKQFRSHMFVPEVLDADVTLLAGDIEHKGRSAAWAAAQFPGKVLLVPGNHEYYGVHFQRHLAKMRAFAQTTGGRVQVLDRDVVVIDGVRFLGATGWTDLSSTGNPVEAELRAAIMNDFKRIRHNDAVRHREFIRWSPSAMVRESRLTRAWLEEQLSIPFAGKTVVMTHHAPSLLSVSHDRYDVSHLDAAYANRWEHLFGDAVDLWVHGHIHAPVDYVCAGTRVVSNPRGYPMEHNPGFNPRLILEL